MQQERVAISELEQRIGQQVRLSSLFEQMGM
jgi:hypothetical protein